MARRTKLGLEIEAGLKEVLEHRQGKISLKGRVVETMFAARAKTRKVGAGFKGFTPI